MSTDRLYALIGAALIVAAFLLGRYAWPSRRALELAMTRSGPAGEICRDCGGWCQPCDCCLTDLQEMDDNVNESGLSGMAPDRGSALPSNAESASGDRPLAHLSPATRDLWSEPLSPSQERAAHALDLPGPEVAADGPAYEDGRAGEHQSWGLDLHPSVAGWLADMSPLDRDKVIGWDAARKQEARLAAWEQECRASWEQAALMASCGLPYRGLVAA